MRSPSLVISVNVGQPRDVAWRGKVVRTAIWKDPVGARVWAGRLGLAGDQQADLKGHGGEQRAIMVYQLDSYRFWAEHLRRSDFVMGQFGENLTVSDLSDEEVCIGDRFRVGSAVVEVSQPRVSCFKLGLRMDHAPMPALVVAHRRPGFYLRVLQEGEIGAGDVFEVLARGPEGMSVAEIDALLFKGDHPRAALERALRIPALSPGWQWSMRELLKADEDGRSGNAGLTAPKPAPAWHGFKALRVQTKIAESEDVISFVLADPDNQPLPAAKPGQHLVLRVPVEVDGPPLLRSYSLCGDGRAGTYRIAVKREADGAASRALHGDIGVGDELSASAPRGDFVLSDPSGPVVLISAGVGLTPVLAMLHAAVDPARTSGHGPVWWIHAARDGAHLPFADEVRGLAATKAVTTRVTFSRPRPEDRKGADYDRAGHVDQDLLRELDLPATATYYLCGPGPFMDAVTAALTAVGVEPSRVLQRSIRPREPREQPRRRTRAPALRPAGRRTAGDLPPKRRNHALERSVREPARTGRSLRGAGQLGLPNRRLPPMRIRSRGGRGELRTRSSGPTDGRGRPDLLRAPRRRRRSRPLTRQGERTPMSAVRRPVHLEEHADTTRHDPLQLVAPVRRALAEVLLDATEALPEASEVGHGGVEVVDDDFAPVARLSNDAPQDVVGATGSRGEEAGCERGMRLGECRDQAFERERLRIRKEGDEPLAEPGQRLLERNAERFLGERL